MKIQVRGVQTSPGVPYDKHETLDIPQETILRATRVGTQLGGIDVLQTATIEFIFDRKGVYCGSRPTPAGPYTIADIFGAANSGGAMPVRIVDGPDDTKIILDEEGKYLGWRRNTYEKIHI